jgi:hypothetical protein
MEQDNRQDWMEEIASSKIFEEQIDFVKDMLDSGLCLEEIREQFYNVYDSICIGHAQLLDYELLNKGGAFWRKAYDFPIENDIIMIGDYEHIAKNVGIFTFDLICHDSHGENEDE